jgi:hypothetical protein
MSYEMGHGWGLGLLLSTLAVAGCGDEDRRPPSRGSTSSNRPVAGCETISHESCDVRAADCQARLLALAACLREDEEPPMPPVTVMSESAFGDYLYELIEEEPQPEVNHLERALVSLGMVEPGAYDVDVVVSDLVTTIAGVYRHETDDILVVVHGAAVDRDMMSSILLHEFVHYLQDLQVDLAAFSEEFSLSTDAALAAISVIEGEAEFHQLRYYASLAGLNPNTVDYRETFDSMVSFSEEYLLEQPSPYTQVRGVFPYAWGGRYMQATWFDGGRDAVAERFASPPTQTRSLMGASTFVDVAARSFESPAAPTGLALYAEDVGGAITLFLYATTIMDVASARELALQWRGDRMSIFATDDDAGTVVVWRIALENEPAAAAFAAAAGRVVASNEIRRDGAEVVIAIGDPVADVEWALSPLE